MSRSKSLPPEYFQKYDTNDDSVFYALPRKVVHIDEIAIATIGTYFSRLLPAGGRYLDLMSSWRSHIPDLLEPEYVAGLGMNADEMRDNPQLDEFAVHDLNRNPTLPYRNDTFNAAICTVSVQYLQRPLDVFAEIYRVLSPGGVFIVSFSNRCFPSKAVQVWLNATDKQRMALVTRYFEDSGHWEGLHADYVVSKRADPVYLVWGYTSVM